MTAAANRPAAAERSAGPLSPHLQIYRPQLTSVLSFAHRLSGVALGLYSVLLVAWLIAAAAGSAPFSSMQTVMRSPAGQLLLLAGIFCFFLHLCGGIRHLFWDAGYGFDLTAIYASGWVVVVASVTLTAIAWFAGSVM
ncbi:MAG TPA: succinate dehydrogenase, cytochrome b556 subunit [Povalibacter sp.]|nr:succinate dehydrogenase, cytochrome b556 subunit [Povalibacter sp.]